MSKGPFDHLRHVVREFHPVEHDTTLMIDRFDFASPFGLAGSIVDHLVLGAISNTC